jgi:hypothetical protein
VPVGVARYLQRVSLAVQRATPVRCVCISFFRREHLRDVRLSVHSAYHKLNENDLFFILWCVTLFYSVYSKFTWSQRSPNRIFARFNATLVFAFQHERDTRASSGETPQTLQRGALIQGKANVVLPKKVFVHVRSISHGLIWIRSPRLIVWRVVLFRVVRSCAFYVFVCSSNVASKARSTPRRFVRLFRLCLSSGFIPSGAYETVALVERHVCRRCDAIHQARRHHTSARA